MKKTFLLIFFLLPVFANLTSCQAQTGKLTKQIVEETIQNSLYPASNNSSVSKNYLVFQNVDIAKPRTLRTEEVYDIPGGTTIYPFLVKFTSTQRTQIDSTAQPLYEIHDITQEYYFYKDEFHKWVLTSVASSENREVDSQKWGQQPGQ